MEENLEMTDELFEHFRYVVEKGQSPIRVDKYLTSKIQNATRSKVQAAIDAECVLVNDKSTKSSYKIRPNDLIILLLPKPPKSDVLLVQDIPLEIVYEDESLLVVNKKAGMVVHPAFGHESETLVNALAFHLREIPLFASGEMRPGLVHRIDKNTSGLLVIAKTEFSLSFLAKQFFEKTSFRRYIALVWGNVEKNEGTITGNIGRHPKDRRVMFVFPNGEEGKNAITHYKVLERFGYVTLVECRLETGRTHQIRAHLKYLGHPLFNDSEYGGDQILKGTTFTKYRQFVENCFKILSRCALHAKSLGFVHPATRKEMFFDSELPLDMSQCIEKWRNYIRFHQNENFEIENC